MWQEGQHPLTGQRNATCFQGGSVPLCSDIKGMELPPANILIPLERQLIALQPCCWHFLYNETLQQTFRPLFSKLSERRQIYVFDPYFVRSGSEPEKTSYSAGRCTCCSLVTTLCHGGMHCTKCCLVLFCVLLCLQCFDAVGWAAGRASGL